MERELNWHELARVIEEHDDYHNFEALTAFCACYYPSATRIVVQVVQEYDDSNYYYTFGPSNLSVFEGDKELFLPTDEVELLILLASPELKAKLEKAQPDDPLEWLEEQYHDDIYNLELCGIEKGYDIEVELTAPPAPLPRVYVKEEVGRTEPEGYQDAHPADV